MPKGNLGFFTVDPATGKITYNFAGHISASGIDILAGDNDTPPNDRKIRWHRTTLAGAVTGSIVSYRSIGSQLALTSANLSNTRNTYVNIAQADAAGDASTRISVNADIDPSGPAQDRVLLDALGRSSFLQSKALSGLRLQVLWGLISSAGVILVGSGGYTVSKWTTGGYVVFPNPAFATLPIVVTTAFSGVSGTGFANLDNRAPYVTNEFGIATIESAAFTDLQFAFVAIGT